MTYTKRMILALALAGCAGEPTSDAGQLNCEASARQWVSELETIAAALGACVDDDDCVIVDSDLRCPAPTNTRHGTCGLAVAAANAAEAERRLTDAAPRVCADAPPCASSSVCPPERAPQCVEGACR